VLVAKYRRWLFALGVIAALGVGGSLRLGPVTWALIAPVVVMMVLATRRDRHDVKAIAERDWAGVSPHGRRLFMAAMRERGSTYVDADRATRTRRDGRVESISWDDVQSVSVAVAPGRFGRADVFISLRGQAGSDLGLVLPYDETPSDFLVHLQTLPGLDADQVGLILQTRPIGTTTCWHRKA
jgi:hypothetical protein